MGLCLQKFFLKAVLPTNFFLNFFYLFFYFSFLSSRLLMLIPAAILLWGFLLKDSHHTGFCGKIYQEE
tara:strand:- start:98 stop:301 length:204 start_codon:yes stop_codon:yes gene_type:complete